MGFSTEAKARIRIIRLILTSIIIIHWCTCLFYVVVKNNYENVLNLSHSFELSNNGEKVPVFEFQFWLPQVDMNDGKTDFYSLGPDVQYAMIVYYIYLVLVGNDIMP